MKLIALILFLITINIQSEVIASNKYLLEKQSFDFPEPTLEQLTMPILSWSTNYYIPEFENGSGEYLLRDLNGLELGPKLSLKNWCMSALEGSVKVTFPDSPAKVYNYHGNSESEPVDCSEILPMDLSKTKFKLSKTQFGEGTASFILVPFRSIATDHTFLPSGTVIYIPEARGNKISIGNETIIHDGYFFVSDRGGSIKDNHIDIFTGILHYTSYFPWIGHQTDSTYKAYIIKDLDIIKSLTELHRKK